MDAAAAMSRVQQRAADFFMLRFLKFFFFYHFFLYLVFCLQLQQQQVNQILFNELAPTFDPLRPPISSCATGTPPLRPVEAARGARLVCQKIYREIVRERTELASLDDM